MILSSKEAQPPIFQHTSVYMQWLYIMYTFCTSIFYLCNFFLLLLCLRTDYLFYLVNNIHLLLFVCVIFLMFSTSSIKSVVLFSKFSFFFGTFCSCNLLVRFLSSKPPENPQQLPKFTTVVDQRYDVLRQMPKPSKGSFTNFTCHKYPRSKQELSEHKSHGKICNNEFVKSELQIYLNVDINCNVWFL